MGSRLMEVRCWLSPRDKIATVQAQMVADYELQFPKGYWFEWDSEKRHLIMREQTDA